MRRLILLILCVFIPAGPSAVACEPPDLCEPPPDRRYPSLGRSLGITIEPDWIARNVEKIHESFRPHCEDFGNCLSVWGNPVDFCRLLFTVELRKECEKTYDMETDLSGWQQCRAVADVFSLGQNRPADSAWPSLQACAAAAAGSGGIASPVVSIEPSQPEPGVEHAMMVKAYHPETGYPMYGLVVVDGTILGPTFQTFRYVLRFTPVTDEIGRVSMSTPKFVIQARPARGSQAPLFASATASLSTSIPATVLTFDPPPQKWTAGENVVWVTATDAASGEVLTGRIMRSGAVIGDVKAPVTISLLPGEAPCGEPVWFRPRQANRPDTSLPIPPCK